MVPMKRNSLLVVATLVLNMLASVHCWTNAGAGMGRALRVPMRTPVAAPRRVASCASVSMNSMELESMRGLAKEKRDEINRLEKLLRIERDSLRNAEERIKVLTGTDRAPVVRETALRSLAKAVGWRITAGIVTFSTSYFFTSGDWRLALAIVGSDFISKSGTMYIGERLFNKVQVGRGKGGDSPWRSIAKALIWRLFALVNTLVVSIFVTGKPSVGAKIAGADSIIKTTLMVLYDQAWNKIDWGRELENVGGDGI